MIGLAEDIHVMGKISKKDIEKIMKTSSLWVMMNENGKEMTQEEIAKEFVMTPRDTRSYFGVTPQEEINEKMENMENYDEYGVLKTAQ